MDAAPLPTPECTLRANRVLPNSCGGCTIASTDATAWVDRALAVTRSATRFGNIRLLFDAERQLVRTLARGPRSPANGPFRTACGCSRPHPASRHTPCGGFLHWP